LSNGRQAEAGKQLPSTPSAHIALLPIWRISATPELQTPRESCTQAKGKLSP
jgi:hypothetical protein